MRTLKDSVRTDVSTKLETDLIKPLNFCIFKRRERGRWRIGGRQLDLLRMQLWKQFDKIYENKIQQ